MYFNNLQMHYYKIFWLRLFKQSLLHVCRYTQTKLRDANKVTIHKSQTDSQAHSCHSGESSGCIAGWSSFSPCTHGRCNWLWGARVTRSFLIWTVCSPAVSTIAKQNTKYTTTRTQKRSGQSYRLYWTALLHKIETACIPVSEHW